MQSTGDRLELHVSCDHCKREQGIFSSCVVAPGLILECRNCHWGGQGMRCSLRDFNCDSKTDLELEQDLERAIRRSEESTRLAQEDADWVAELKAKIEHRKIYDANLS